MTMNECKEKSYYKISGFCGEVDDIARRFMELGLVIGEKVKICGKSLQKKVFLIEVRGYLLSIRASLLQRVQVEKC